MLTSARLKARALELGFDACGIAPATALPELDVLPDWVDRGYAGQMTFLTGSVARRADARGAMASSRSVIVTATLYQVKRPYSTECTDPMRAHVSRHAWGDDYHVVIMKRLDALIQWMHEVHRETFQACPYVDTGPVQERVYARHAGIGWIGKNSCVIHPELGSWLFLGVILCSLPLEPDTPSLDQCGTCALCLEACPTQAFAAPGVLDARRCVSYLTIEQPGPIPEELGRGVGSWVYGCDVCQEVCPFNAAAPTSGDPAWQPRSDWDGIDVHALARRTDVELRAAMRGGAMQRAGLKSLRRNIAVVLKNAGAPSVTQETRFRGFRCEEPRHGGQRPAGE